MKKMTRSSTNFKTDFSHTDFYKTPKVLYTTYLLEITKVRGTHI